MTLLQQAAAFKKIREDVKQIKINLEHTAQTAAILPDDEQMYNDLLATIKTIIAQNSAITKIGNNLSKWSLLKLAMDPNHSDGAPLKDALDNLKNIIYEIKADCIDVCGEKSLLATRALVTVLEACLTLDPQDQKILGMRDALNAKAEEYEAGLASRHGLG